MVARVIAFPPRPKRRGRRPWKRPDCPIVHLHSDSDALYRRALRLDECKSTRTLALKLYHEALRICPADAKTMTNVGNCHHWAGDSRAAREWYEKALAVDPGQPEAHYNLGYLESEAGFHAAAVQRYRTSIALDSALSDAYYNLGLSLDSLGDRVGAEQAFRQYVKLESDGPWADHARRWLGMVKLALVRP